MQAAAVADYMARLVDDCTRLDASEVIVNSVVHAPIGKSLINWLLQVRARPRAGTAGGRGRGR